MDGLNNMKVSECTVGAIVTRFQINQGKPTTLQTGIVQCLPYKRENKSAMYYAMVQFEKGQPIEVYVARLQLKGIAHNLNLVIG